MKRILVNILTLLDAVFHVKKIVFWNTRYPKYPMILKTNRVRIGYWKKLRVRVGYRVPVGHWMLVWPKNMLDVQEQEHAAGSVFLVLLTLWSLRAVCFWSPESGLNMPDACSSIDAMISACCLFLVCPINGLDTNADWHGRNKSSKTKPPTTLKKPDVYSTTDVSIHPDKLRLDLQGRTAGRLLVC